MVEIFKKHTGTLEGEACPLYRRYNFRKKMVFSKVTSTCPEEHFQQFSFKTQKVLDFIGNPKAKTPVESSKLHSACPVEHFWEKNKQVLNL